MRKASKQPVTRPDGGDDILEKFRNEFLPYLQAKKMAELAMIALGEAFSIESGEYSSDELTSWVLNLENTTKIELAYLLIKEIYDYREDRDYVNPKAD
jgi:hypothetical protein